MSQIERLKARLEGEDFTDALLDELLETAKDIIFEHRFPYSEYPTEVETRYLGLQVQIAVELFNKLGGEGQLGHTENGITRSMPPLSHAAVPAGACVRSQVPAGGRLAPLPSGRFSNCSRKVFFRG